MQQLDLNDGNLLHLLKPLSLENTVLLIIHVVKKLFFVKALDLNYLGWLLDLEHFSDHGWNSVRFEVIRARLTRYDLDSVLYYTNFKLINLVLAIDVDLYSQGYFGVVVWRLCSLAFLQSLVEDFLVAVEVVNRA